ncbi:MAG TPA: hypothetical protein VKQ54_16265 [Caulobacteraceae bacterium]|nr:hypothetical protein [Caulobacteraceae bacterium]
MRTIATAGLLAALITLAPRAFSAAADQPPPPPPAPPSNPNGELQTPDRAGTANVAVAATAPLHDLNVTRQGIPPVLLAAITNPYDLPRPLDCGEITRQLGELNFVLGADLDEPETPQAPSLTRKNGHLALALLRGAADSLLPFAGFVRTLSGAQHHDQLVIEAVTAGSVRRGYLKGLGESLRCPRPARPIHFLKAPPPAREDGPAPRYPIR